MADTKQPWFVAERSAALAGLLLTARNDVRVRSKQEHDDGVDYLAEINNGEALSTRLFVVQVRGTMSSDPNEWMGNVGQLFGGGTAIYLPACVFVVNVRENRAVYAWVAEPEVEMKGATLRFHESGEFHDLDSSAVNGIVNRVKAWYDALPRQLVPA